MARSRAPLTERLAQESLPLRRPPDQSTVPPARKKYGRKNADLRCAILEDNFIMDKENKQISSQDVESGDSESQELSEPSSNLRKVDSTASLEFRTENAIRKRDKVFRELAEGTSTRKFSYSDVIEDPLPDEVVIPAEDNLQPRIARRTQGFTIASSGIMPLGLDSLSRSHKAIATEDTHQPSTVPSIQETRRVPRSRKAVIPIEDDQETEDPPEIQEPETASSDMMSVEVLKVSRSRKAVSTGSGTTASRRSARNQQPTYTDIDQALQGLTINENQVFETPGPTFYNLDQLHGREYLRPLVQESNQQRIQRFEDWAGEIIKHYHILKIAEGSFGEVFKVCDKEGETSTTKHNVRKLGGCILKVMAINAERGPGSRKFSDAKNVAQEIMMLRKMDPCHGFARFRDVYVLEGRMETTFVDAWRQWKSNPKNESQMSDPSIPSSYSDRQIWAVFEMDDAGEELETFKRPSVYQIYDIFWSVTLALAYGEMFAEFEHRDLHISNVCVRSRISSGLVDISPELNETMVKAPRALLGLSNAQATIIDYTMARALLHQDKPSSVVYQHLDKKRLFAAKGRDEEEVLQRDVGRRMWEAVDAAAAKAESSRGPQAWARSVPKTNVVWLGYLLAVLLRRGADKAYSNSSPASLEAQRELWSRLQGTLKAIGPESAVADVPESAGELKDLAIGSGWLLEEDFEGWMDSCK